jgi:two-component system sensor histidine kinase YesM
MNSIRSRLIIYILLTTVIPIVAFLLYTLLFVSDGLQRNAFDAKEMEVSWANQYLEQVTDQLDDIAYSIHLEDQLLTLVDNSSSEYTEIEDILRDNLYNNSNILSKVTIVSMNSYRGVSFDYENGFVSKTYTYDNLLLDFNDETHGLTFMEDGEEIIVVHTINDFNTQSLQGVVLLRLSNTLKDELRSILGSDSTYALFTSSQDIVLNGEIASDTLHQSNYILESTQQIEGDYIWTKQVGNYDLYLSSFVPVGEINAFSRNMILVGVLIILLSFAVTVVISILFTNDITSPIISLVSHMKQSNLVAYQNDKKSYSEITDLEIAYNDMIGEINTLITEKYRNEIERQSIQLKALQAQINPHFLSNTFQLIGGMAMNQGAHDIYEATIKMSNLVRYSMRIEEEAVSMKQELHHIKGYLDIQKLRFDDQLNFTVQIDDPLMQIKLPKFTFQPILENSFKYGLKKVERTWNIAITSSISDTTNIHISDNGVGMSEEHMDHLNDRFTKNNMDFDSHGFTDKPSIGLINIDSRIKLLYGTAYGLHITPNHPYGVTVTIILPQEGVSQ